MIKNVLVFFEKNKSAAVSTTLVVAILCFIPSEQIPDTNTDDKTAHFLSFGVMVFLWLLYSKNYIITAFWLMIFAITIEIVQKNLPVDFHRGFEFADMVADGIGIFFGSVFYYLFQKYLRKYFA